MSTISVVHNKDLKGLEEKRPVSQLVAEGKTTDFKQEAKAEGFFVQTGGSELSDKNIIH